MAGTDRTALTGGVLRAAGTDATPDGPADTAASDGSDAGPGAPLIAGEYVAAADSSREDEDESLEECMPTTNAAHPMTLSVATDVDSTRLQLMWPVCQE